MATQIIVKGYNSNKRIKPMENYLKGKDLYDKAVIQANWNKEMALFNAYKHRYTSYHREIDTIYKSDFSWEESINRLKIIYSQLMLQVPTKYKKACKDSLLYSIEELKQHIENLI